MPIPDDYASINTDFHQLVAAAADLCRKPLRHAVIGLALDQGECSLKLEVRDANGIRQPNEDLELEIYRSGDALNLTLTWIEAPDLPLLWHGSHPVWMDASTGMRCDRPEDGAPLEALSRRLRSLLGQG